MRKRQREWTDYTSYVFIGLFIVLVVVMLFIGDGNESIVYEGKELPLGTVEDIIGDKLEVDNPSWDIDITITKEGGE